MQPAIDQNTLESLIALGRQKGSLTNRDLEAALPTGAMSVEDIALVVLQLEEAGVPIDLDEDLLSRSQGAVASRPLQSAEILPFPKRSDDPPKAHPMQELSAALSPAPQTPSVAAIPSRRAHWAVIGSILIVVLIALAILILRN
ncbi:RNA polymerase sigma factor region1.1 domain-containing protein [Microvirga subterranea]|uniref:Sigma-70-like protein n=1 Tax=Microvirga subterranea TaxID=186651 RepID=A0A370HVX5_9HYPH|nr:RNA polymerase sigma factor region1.1 domain-containing protein [Microvirga subterranea]RDI62659.1 sigma-70-like protein [Microvirga subterranea]